MTRRQVRTPSSKQDLKELITQSVSDWVTEEIDLDWVLDRIKANLSRRAIITKDMEKKRKAIDAMVVRNELKLEFYPGKFVYGSSQNIRQLEEMIEHLFPTIDPFPPYVP